MSKKIEQIINNLKTLTLLEASELVKEIEKTFDIDTSTKVSPIVSVATSNSEKSKVEEQSEFDIILDEVPKNKKISILKTIRSLTQLGLKEAKTLVESVPQSIQKNVTKKDAENIKKKLEDVGAKILLK